jgi:hypothetical protein
MFKGFLMIEFAPATLAGNTLRLHWLAAFRRDGQAYFFAGTKRPGHIAGPYKDTDDFIRDYEQYRGRKILAFRDAESYKKQQRSRARKVKTFGEFLYREAGWSGTKENDHGG